MCNTLCAVAWYCEIQAALMHRSASMATNTPACVQDQTTRLFGPAATLEAMSVAIGLEVLHQPDFNFLEDLTPTEQKAFDRCTLPLCTSCVQPILPVMCLAAVRVLRYV